MTIAHTVSSLPAARSRDAPGEHRLAGEARGEQRIEFVQKLWDRIAQDPECVPVPDEHKRILDERLDAYEADPRAGRPWSEVRDELLQKLRRS